MKIDLHVHTKFSGDSSLEPERLIEKAREVGLDGVCITEHWSYNASKPLEDFGRQQEFLILRGVEYHSAEGHLLLFGVHDDSYYNGRKYLPARDVISCVQAQGGVVVASHPYIDWRMLRNRSDGLSNPTGEEDMVMGDRIYELSGLLTAVETVNGAMARLMPEANIKAEEARKSLSLPGTGGSDSHYDWELGSAYTVFTDRITNLLDLIQALKKGRCYPEWRAVE